MYVEFSFTGECVILPQIFTQNGAMIYQDYYILSGMLYDLTELQLISIHQVTIYQHKDIRNLIFENCLFLRIVKISMKYKNIIKKGDLQKFSKNGPFWGTILTKFQLHVIPTVYEEIFLTYYFWKSCMMLQHIERGTLCGNVLRYHKQAKLNIQISQIRRLFSSIQAVLHQFLVHNSAAVFFRSS